MTAHKISLQQCLDAGFSNAAYLDPAQLEFLPEVREMCEANRCGKYGKSWSCPPGCGTLDELAQQVQSYPYGILLQVTGQLADDFDFEAMQRTEQALKAALAKLADTVRPITQRTMILSAGCCKICETCTYPDQPCRYPERMDPSLEACGLFVTRECERAGIPYYYGPRTMTYVAAILIED